MKVLTILGGMMAGVGFLGMVGVDAESPTWLMTLIGFFVLFVIGVSLSAFTCNRFSIYAKVYATVSVIGAIMYRLGDRRKFPRFCRELLATCGNNYGRMYRLVQNRYLSYQVKKGVICTDEVER